MIVGREWGRNRLLVAVILMLVVGAVGCVWWVHSLPSSQRAGAIQLGGFVLALVTGLVTAVGWLWRARHLGGLRPVDTLGDLLAQAVYGQWRKAATERVLVIPAPIPIHWSLSSLPVAGELTAALDGPFRPLPGLAAVVEEQLRAGGGRRELFEVYAGLGSGRIVVVGSPGSGKSGSAVLLLLDALDDRERANDTARGRVPVPVLFTAHDWDPNGSSVQDWLCDRLAETYPLFQHRSGQAEAATLVGAPDKVALILDGLDEMDEALRPAALRALSDAPFRVVLLTRSHEMIQVTRSGWFIGAAVVHLDAITGCQAADYLQRATLGPPPSGWSQLLTHLREQLNSVLTRALSTPLTLTLIRDTYRAGDDVSELLDASRYRTVEHIEQHLIARVLPEAYTPRPGRPPPRYNAVQATQTLAFIAQQMNQCHTRDFAWWHISRSAPATPRILASILAGGLLGVLASWLMACLVHGFGYNLFNLGFGLGLGTLFGLAHGKGGGEPKRIRSWRAVSFRSLLLGGFVYGLVFSTMAYFIVLMMRVTYLLTFGPQSELPIIMAGFIIGLIAAFPLGLKHEPTGGVIAGQSISPGTLKNWRTEGVIALVAGLVVGLLIGLGVGRRDGLTVGLLDGLMFGPVCGLLMAAAYGTTRRLTIRSVVEGESRPLGPRESWRNDRALGVVAGLMVGLATTTGYWLYVIVVHLMKSLRGGAPPRMELLQGLTNGIVFGLVMLFVFGITSSVTWPTTMAWLQLQRSCHIPVIALMPFLEDARERGVLRTIGAAYQFRHAMLQDRLADQAPAFDVGEGA
jgi:hypothetical protein